LRLTSPSCRSSRPLMRMPRVNFINCASDLYKLGRVARPFPCSSYFPIAPGILYKPVTPMRHRMIGILRCGGLLYPPFRKEHARDRVPLLASRRWAGVEPAFRPSPAHGAVRRSSARKIDTTSQPIVFQAWPCIPSGTRPDSRSHEGLGQGGGGPKFVSARSRMGAHHIAWRSDRYILTRGSLPL
jgi:hypothetical protein